MSADFKLFYTCAILIAIGIVFSLSLSVFTVLYYDYGKYHFFVRQLLVGFVGIMVIWLFSKLDPDQKVFGDINMFEFIGFTLFFGSIILLIAMQFMPSSLAPITGGAKRWIRLGVVSLSPVEFFKVGFIFFLAWSFTRKIDDTQKRLGEEFKLLMPYFVLFGAFVVFLVGILQKDLGQVVVLGFVLMILATFAGTSKKLFVLSGIMALFLFVLLIFTQPHRIKRLESWWIVNQDFILKFFPQDLADMLRLTSGEEPYQITHSLNAIYHGGFFGVGLGNGTFKLGFLSEVHTDFVLAGIAEEIGFVGILGITALFLFMVFRILRISARSENKSYHLFTLGIGTMITLAFIINAYGITSISPIKGIAVPFLSYGGSSILALCVGIGMVLMISKKANLR